MVRFDSSLYLLRRNPMIKKQIIVLEKSGKKHELTIREPENPVTIEFAVNCSASNYSDAVLNELAKRNIAVDDVLSVKYVDDTIEKYQLGQGKEIKNRI
jgi:hypothetical protein